MVGIARVEKKRWSDFGVYVGCLRGEGDIRATFADQITQGSSLSHPPPNPCPRA